MGRAPSARSLEIEDLVRQHCEDKNIPVEVFLRPGRGAASVQEEIEEIRKYTQAEINNSFRSIRATFVTAPKKSSITNVSNNSEAIKISLSIRAEIEGDEENNITLINGASINDGQKKTSPAQAPAQHGEGIDDGQKESPPVRYVESVTTTNFVGGSVTEVKVHKSYSDASLGIRTYDSKQGEVKILKFEDESPMGPLLKGPLEEGMTIIAVNNEEITSSEKFVKVYNKCPVGKNVVIKVGPKKMSEASNIIEDLDRERKYYEDKSEHLEKENQQLGDLEKKYQQLEKKNQLLQEQLEKERAVASHFRKMARVLEATRSDLD